MKKTILTIVLMIALAITTISNAQVGIGAATTDINPPAQLEVASTSDGFLPPRTTTSQRDAISSPAPGVVMLVPTKNRQEYKAGMGGVSITPAPAVNYPGILIGAKYWMAQNLDVTTYRNGDPIPYVSDPAAWAGLTTGAWCYYNNDPANGEIYGRLYNWYAVHDSVHGGLAPAGWHVPKDAEWRTLVTTLGGTTVAGGKMIVADSARRTTPNKDADTRSGFAGLPGGYRNNDGTFDNIGFNGYWWSSTEHNTSNAWFHFLLYYNYSTVSRNNFYKTTGFSVRCLKD